jgi:hypothetical protein
MIFCATTRVAASSTIFSAADGHSAMILRLSLIARALHSRPRVHSASSLTRRSWCSRLFQMTVTQMSITESTDSPQHKLHWLAEQALSWSGLPVVTMRPTVFLEGFFLLFAAPGVRDADELALPLGGGKTSPISAVDVARAVSPKADQHVRFRQIARR